MDLAQRRQQLRLKQVDAVKKFRQTNMSVSAATQKRKEREEIKKEVRKEIENESTNIENSDGSLYANITDIVGPAHMKPVVLDGVWKVYHENEVLSMEGLWENGELISEKCWDENGNEIKCK